MQDIKREIKEVPVSQIIPLEENIREMSDEEFNALCKSIEENGYAEPIQVVETPDGKYRIVNGQHRYEALVNVFGVDTVTVIVLGRMCKEGEDPEKDGCWDEYRYWAEVIRLNNIRGDWKKPALAKKIFELWEYYKKKGYDRLDLKERLGFTGAKTFFDKLFEDVKKSLPKDIAEELEKKKDKIDTVEDLSRIINEIMRKSGNTVKYGYLIFSLGGKQHILVRALPELFSVVRDILDYCKYNGRNASEVLYELLSGWEEKLQ